MTSTHNDRIAKLMALLSIAFVWCDRVGEWQVALKPIRKLKHGRQAKSLFRPGKDFLQRQWQAMTVADQFAETLQDLLTANNINKYYSPLA